MQFKLQLAQPEDAAAIAALRVAVSQKLTERYGHGHWTGSPTERGVLWDMRKGKVYVVRQRGKVVATLTLCSRKPWAIDRKYFTACRRPLYLTAMAVSPEVQRQGIGRHCLEEAAQVVKRWPGDAIFLDAFDADAGAGEFYRKCGFREVGRAAYRGVPLVYLEMLL